MTRSRDTSQVQDNGASAVAPFVAGKNKIINGDFGVWARGTSFSNPNGVYTADRWYVGVGTAVPTWTISQQAFTAGAAPVSGYEGTYFYRAQVTSQNGSTSQIVTQRIEDVRTFAGQTVTISFWAKADSSKTMGAVVWGQNFGSGGSSAVETTAASSFSLTSSWQRFSVTLNVPSISGATVGSSSYVYLQFWLPSTATYTWDFWGVQVERGSVATPFTTATGTVQGELAACQRYFRRLGGTQNQTRISVGWAASGSSAAFIVPISISMRTVPTVSISTLSNLFWYDLTLGATFTSFATSIISPVSVELVGTGSSGLTTGRAVGLTFDNAATYMDWSAEL